MVDTTLEKKKLPSEEKVWQKYYPEGAKNFDFPKMKTYDLIFEENRNRKDTIAIEYEGNEICYGELFDKIEERTEFLNSKGIKPNEVVTVTMLMSPEFIYDWYALGRLNAVSDLIDPRTTKSGIKHYLEEDEARYILNTDIFTPKVLMAARKNKDIEIMNYSLSKSGEKMSFELGAISTVTGALSKAVSVFDKRFQIMDDDFIKSDSGIILPDYVSDQPLTIVRTGGTTGLPKGVLLSHDNYNAMAMQYIKSEIGFEPDDRFLLVMPPWISYGSGMLHLSMVRGMKVKIIPKLDSNKMPQYIIKYEPQWFAGVPKHYSIISDSKYIPENGGTPFLKAGAVGGDAVPAQLFNKVNEFMLKNGASQGMYPGYAFTEVSSVLCVRQKGNFKPGSVGTPLPGVTIGIFKYDEENEITLDEELEYNKIGEICAQTPTEMLGYFKNDEETKQVIRTHKDGSVWVHSGDLGYLDEDGFLFVTGRIKEMITRYDGFKIYPNAIEKIINTHKAIDSCKVVGINDIINKEGQVPRAYIVLKPEYAGKEYQVFKELKNLCALVLPKYYTEYLSFDSLEKLPLTAIGKVDFKTLQKLGNSQQKGKSRVRKTA